MFTKKILFLSFFASAFCAIPLQKTIMFDPTFSPETGAHNLISLVEWIEKYPQLNKRHGFGPLATRLLLDIFMYNPINILAVTLQHEVFGHGWRVRSFHNPSIIKVQSYRIHFPPPYGLGGGSTSIKANTERITPSQFLAVLIGGMEANAILARIQKLDWLEQNCIIPRQTSMYTMAQQDIFFYILSTGLFTSDGHDVNLYIQLLNNTYPQNPLTKEQLRNLALFNLLDPMSFYAIWTNLRYLFTGKGFRPLLIKYKQMSFLPNFRLGLSPFTPEVYFENFFKVKDHWMIAYIRFGNHKNLQTYGFGIDRLLLFKKSEVLCIYKLMPGCNRS